VIKSQLDYFTYSYLSSPAKALWVQQGEDLESKVSWENSGEVVVRRWHCRMEELVNHEQLRIALLSQQVLKECPPLIIIPGRVLVDHIHLGIQ